jgi:hypothetical protein
MSRPIQRVTGDAISGLNPVNPASQSRFRTTFWLSLEMPRKKAANGAFSARCDVDRGLHALPHLESGTLVRLAPQWYVDGGPISIYYASRTVLPAKTSVRRFRHRSIQA